MKTKILSLLSGIIFLGSIVNAQIPTNIAELGYAFHGYAVDKAGEALSNTDITVRFTIISSGFSEVHQLKTDVFGVFTAKVGSINTSAFKLIDYSTKQTLKVEVAKTEASLVYITIDEAELLSVPYARYALKAFEADTADLASDVETAPTAISADLATTSSFATESDYAYTTISTDTANFATYADSALIVDTAYTAILAYKADSALYTYRADTAYNVGIAYAAKIAANADTVSIADNAIKSKYAKKATKAIFAMNGMPVGAIVFFYGTVLPKGWLWCNGNDIAETHQKLINLLGTYWGVRGKTPDLETRFLRGANDTLMVGERQKQSTHVKTEKFTFKTLRYRVAALEVNDVKYFATAISSKEPEDTSTNEELKDEIEISFETDDTETRPTNTTVSYIIKY
jgi:microcystin-dependent protein